MKTLFASFYTGDGYAIEARQLIDTLRHHGLEYVVEERANAGDWLRNCGGKAAFLLDVRRRFPGRPVVWVDADARIREQPILFDVLNCDIGAHWWQDDHLASGTVYVGTSEHATRLLEAWRDACNAHPEQTDQAVLQGIIETWPHRLHVAKLPATYCAIFDAGIGNPVIEHMQASRRLRQ
jgi:hypothetical protein